MGKIIAIFHQSDMTELKYKNVLSDLQNSGVGSPKGRITHVAATDQGGKGVLVVDTWQSEELMNQFSEKLIPILQKNGVTPAKPEIAPITNEIT